MKKSLLIFFCVALCMFAFTAGVSAESAMDAWMSADLFQVNEDAVAAISDGELPAAGGIALDKSEAILAPNESVALVLSGTEEGDVVAWSSSNEAVATVDNGTVTGLKKGYATISATVGDQTVTCTVKVNNAPVLAGASSMKAHTPTGCPYIIDFRTIFTDPDGDFLSCTVSVDGGESIYAGGNYYAITNYQLGHHTIVITCKDGIEDCPETFTIDLTVNKYGYAADIWNGAVDISWYDEYLDVFSLSTPAQLAGLAAIVNGEIKDADGNVIKDDFAGRTIRLTEDICLNDASFSFEEAYGAVKITKDDHTVYLATDYLPSDESVPDFYWGTYRQDPHVNNSYYPISVGKKWMADLVELREWPGIGNSRSPFKGTFDGGNHEITGLFSCKDENALFGQCDGVIRNVSLGSGLVTKQVNNAYGIAPLVYQFNGTLLENCTSEVMVNAGTLAGGLACNIRPSSDCVVRNLSYDGIVLGGSYFGGIAGSVSAPANATLTITNCINRGTMFSTGLTYGVGGLLGSASAGSGHLVLSELVNTGAVAPGNSISATHAGGIVALISSMQKGYASLSNAYNVGMVKGKTNVGGVVGQVNTGYSKYSNGDASVESCYSIGKAYLSSFKNECESAVGTFSTKFNNGNTYCKNVYYLTVPENNIEHKEIEGVAAKTAEELLSEEFLLEIGEAFAEDRDKINNGYPVLAIQSAASGDKELTRFALGESEGVIDGKTITINDYAVIAEGNVLTFAPEVEASVGATVQPASGEEAVFTQSEEDDSLYSARYVVTAANGSKRPYTVNIATKAAVSGISLRETEISVVAGYLNKALVPVVAPANANNKGVVWSSSDDAIATVDENGIVTGVKAGTAVVTATTKDGGKMATCTVTVTPYIPVTSLTLPETASVMKDETITLAPVFAPENASDQIVEWSSSDESIATVDEKGVVSAVNIGTATITATAENETSVTATCTVTVTKIPVKSVTVTQSKWVRIGGSKKINATVLPETATEPGVEWTSSDESVATVDENGVVTGVKEGTVIITATARDNNKIKGTVKLEICKEYPYDVEWSGVFNGNEANNNTTDVALPTDPEKITEMWRAEAGNGSVAIVDDYVYTYAAAAGMDGFQIGGETRAFYKIDKETGEIVDIIHDCPVTGGYYYAYTIYGDGMLYVAANQGVLGIDLDSFSLVWSYSHFIRSYSAVQYVNGYVVANGNVLDGVTGEPVKTLDGTYNYSNGAVVGGKYFSVLSIEGMLYTYNTDTWDLVDSCRFKSGGSILQPGAVYHKGRLYWGNAMGEGIYSVKIDEATGKIDADSLITTNCGFTTVCTPVAYGDRIYLAGQSNSQGRLGVYDAETLKQIYVIKGTSGKFQSTPILHADKETGIVHLYVQAYEGSALYLLTDDGKQTSGTLEKLATPSQVQFAFEQLACDKDGALYCTNDSGNLFKFMVTTVRKPQIETDLSSERITVTKGETAETLTVQGVSLDGGAISYQWQSSADGNQWTNIEGQNDASYIPASENEGKCYYRCAVMNTLEEKTATAYSSAAEIVVIPVGGEEISVSFRLIGATIAEEPVDFSEAPGDLKGSEYVTWLKTKYYTMAAGSTVGDLFKKACDEAGIKYIGWEQDYIRTICAPEACGGYELSEFSNGTNSGWMYTINGSHPSKSIGTMDLHDGDVVVFHYVNDYKYEDESTNPDSEYLGLYLKAPDKNPGDEYTDAEIAQPVIDLIDAIGEVTEDSGEAIAAAREAYDALSREQQSHVSNYEQLVAAEKAYDALDKDPEEPVKPEEPGVEVIDPSELSFEDLTEDWYKEAIAYVYSYELMNGTSATAFEPQTTLNRAMMATILYRIEGEPAVKAENSFGDVQNDANGSWYYNAVLWASQNGIVKGYEDDTFRPVREITREEMAVMMYRYAEYKGMDMTATADFAKFSDGATVNEWAKPAMSWAVGVNLITGHDNGTLEPQGTATRAQAATVLMRFNELMK